MNSQKQHDDLHALFVRYFDDALSDAELQQLNTLLESSPESRAHFNDWVLQAQLVAEADVMDAAAPATLVRDRVRLPLSRLAAIAAVLVFLIGSIAFFVFRQGDPQEPGVIAKLEATKGTVDVEGDVRSGQIVNSQGAESSAVLIFRDGTRLVLAGDTSLTVSETSEMGKRIELHSGNVTASVTPQPEGLPMVLVTSQAEVQVLGTEFSLSASSEATGLGVTKGNVRVVRLSDGKSVDVGRDRYVVAAPDRAFESRPQPPMPQVIDLEFSEGLPSGWVRGLHLAAEPGLPARVATEPMPGQPRGVHHQIFTQNPWHEGMSGLFAIHDDSHLHIRYRMKDPGFFQIFMGTRATSDPTSRPANFSAANLGKKDQPDQWRTLSISLAKMRNLQGKFSTEGRFATFLLFDTQEVERGFELERVWVTRGEEAK